MTGFVEHVAGVKQALAVEEQAAVVDENAGQEGVVRQGGFFDNDANIS
jgi:hypothetical protein